MVTRAVSLDVKDVRVLDALDMPRTTSEIYELLMRRVWEGWAEETGHEILWDESDLPSSSVVRLLAWAWAHNRGWHLDRTAVYNRLRKLERAGLVSRLQMPSHSRSILWLRTEAST